MNKTSNPITAFLRTLLTGRRGVRLLAPILSALGAAAALGAFAACGARSELGVGGGPPTPVADASADAPADAPPDAPADAPPDAPADAPPDAPADAPADAPVDAPPDAPTDAGPSCGDGGLTAYLWDVTGFLYTFDPATLGVAPVGQVTCPTAAEPWTLSVSQTGVAYMLYADWNIFRVDLGTLDCTPTPYVPGQLGLSSVVAIAVSRGQGVERLFVYGDTPVSTLGVSDLVSFVLSPVGSVTPPPTVAPVDMQGDAFGQLYVLGNDGTFFELDSTTAQVSSLAAISFPVSDWAVMVYGTDVYFFTGADGTVDHYDPSSQELTLLTSLGIPVVGASAAPCVP